MKHHLVTAILFLAAVALIAKPTGVEQPRTLRVLWTYLSTNKVPDLFTGGPNGQAVLIRVPGYRERVTNHVIGYLEGTNQVIITTIQGGRERIQE